MCQCRRTNLRLAQQTEKLTTLDEVHYHVQVLRVLECAPERDQEGMLDLLQHATLVVGVLDLLHLDNLLLFEDLDGIEALVMLGLDKMDTSETAGSQGAVDGKVLQGVLALCLADGVGGGLGLLHVCGIVGVVVLCLWLVDEVLDAGSILLRLLGLLRLRGELRLLLLGVGLLALGLRLLLLDWVGLLVLHGLGRLLLLGLRRSQFDRRDGRLSRGLGLG